VPAWPRCVGDHGTGRGAARRAREFLSGTNHFDIDEVANAVAATDQEREDIHDILLLDLA
jgi:hypothetical protein